MLLTALSQVVRVFSSIILVAVIAGTTMPTKGGAQEPTVLHVVVGVTEFDAEAYYAQDLGLFKKHGLTVDIQRLNRGPEAIAAVVGGTFQIGDANTLSLASAVQRGVPLQFVAPGAQYSSAVPTELIVVAPNSPIHSAKDLNGRTVGGIAVHSLGQLYLWAWVDKNGGDSKTLTFAEFPAPLIAPAVLSGRIAAAALDEPFLSMYRSKLRVLGRGAEAVGKELLISAYFARSDWASKNPAIVKAFSSSITEAAAWANENPVKAAQVMDKYTKAETKRVHVYYAQKMNASLIQPILDGAAKYKFLSSTMSASRLLGSK